MLPTKQKGTFNQQQRETIETRERGYPVPLSIPDLPVTDAVFVSARTELINGIRTTMIQVRQIKNGRTRDYLNKYYPPYYYAETATAHAVLNQVLPLASTGQTIFYSLPGLENKLPYPQQGVSFAPISADSNPTQRLLHQAILEGITHA